MHHRRASEGGGTKVNELQVFKSAEFGEVRTIEESGSILFCGSDVAKALCYTNPSKALNDHCRCDLTKRYPIVDALGRTMDRRVQVCRE